MEPEEDQGELEERLRELEEIEEEERRRVVQEALGKFSFFLHVTAWLTGCAYLVLLGIFVSKALPWVFIPIGIWTIGLGFHCWRAWHPGSRQERAVRKALKQLEKEEAEADGTTPEGLADGETLGPPEILQSGEHEEDGKSPWQPGPA